MHFLVAVVTYPGHRWQDLLAPYDALTKNEEYGEFVDKTEELKKYFNNVKYERIKGPDGELYSTIDRKFKVKKKDEHGQVQCRYIYPAGYEKVNVPVSEIHGSFDKFIESCNLVKTNDGRFGRINNPNKRFDWYEMGGRWPGELILKKGIKSGQRGTASEIASSEFKKSAYQPIDGQLVADQAEIKDIDWEKMKEIQTAIANENWIRMQDKSIQNRESMYTYEITKEEYIKLNTYFNTIAVITPDGKWVSEENYKEYLGQDANWEDGLYKNFLENLDPECTVSLIDCHD